MKGSEGMTGTDPSVNSESQQERILARRNRINEREEQKNQPNKPLITVQTSKAPSIVHNTADDTTNACADSLDDFKKTGEKLLSDVHIAAQNHESERRREQERQQRELLERLETEARHEQDKFQEILNKWGVSSSCRTPQDLNSLLVEQTKSCSNVIQQKSKFIDLLKGELRQADDRYTKDLKRQNKDMELIAKRMEEHVKEITVKFENSLQKVSGALLADRSNTLAAANDKSENAWKARALREIEMVYEHLEDTDKYTNELDVIRQKAAEDFAVMKDKLERDVSTHEQQLQQMKAIYQLNQEKLQYNWEILRNREDENQHMKSQQKRKITKLQDNLNTQRHKLQAQVQQHKQETNQLSEDYERIVQQHKELQIKQRHFNNSDSKRFHEVWKMNFNTVKNLASECLLADRIIHHQQLGLKWSMSEEKNWFVAGNLDEVQGSNSSTSAASVLDTDPVLAPWQEANIKRSASDVIKSAEDASTTAQSTNASQNGGDPLEKMAEVVAKNSKLSISTVRTLLPLVADEGDFLFEQKLSTLLSGLENSFSTLIKLDTIFTALGIQTEDDITLLTEQINAVMGEDMDVNKILPALKEFLAKHSNSNDPMAHVTRAANNKVSTLTGQEWAALEPKYWAEIQDVITSRTLNIWDALDQGNQKYNDVLKERKKLIGETDNLKRQNAELRLLLQQYLSSKVNQELRIPPTRVLQSEAK